jgi:hypothetical protein
MKVRVYDTYGGDCVEDYTIIETENEKTGNPVYNLVRSGAAWNDHAKGQTAISAEDTGSGYKITNVNSKEMGYDVVSELYILLSYLNTLGTGLYKGQIEIITDYETVHI